MEQTTQTATITAQYVNEPRGNGPGSVRDDQGRYWKVWKVNKAGGATLGQFEAGKQYNITYKTDTFQGKDSQTIMTAVLRGNALPQSNGQMQTRPRTSKTDSESIMVSVLLKESRFDSWDRTDIIELVNKHRDVYAATFGNTDE